MASMSSSENWVCDFDHIEVSEMDRALLMALLEESQDEEAEDERLKSVVQSLETEIDLKMVDGHGSTAEPKKCDDNNYVDRQIQDVGLEEGRNCFEPLASLAGDFDWIDMEMASSSLSDEMNWYMDCCVDEMVGMAEFGERDYSQFYYGEVSEEHVYSSLWQDRYDSMM